MRYTVAAWPYWHDLGTKRGRMSPHRLEGPHLSAPSLGATLGVRGGGVKHEKRNWSKSRNTTRSKPIHFSEERNCRRSKTTQKLSLQE